MCRDKGEGRREDQNDAAMAAYKDIVSWSSQHLLAAAGPCSRTTVVEPVKMLTGPLSPGDTGC